MPAPDEGARVRERLAQSRRARDIARAAALTDTRAVPVAAGCALCLGDRVFDLVSGEEGVIVGGTTENVLVPVARE